MKRSASEDGRNTKRVKLQDPVNNKVSDAQNFDQSLRRNPQDLLHKSKVDRPPGHIYGKVSMKWELKDRLELILESRSSVKLGREEIVVFEVRLGALDKNSVRLLDFRKEDSVYLSLKGAQIEHLPQAKKVPHAIPLKLIFSEGFHVKYGNQEFNSWAAKSNAKPPELKAGAASTTPEVSEPARAEPENVPPEMSKKQMRRLKKMQREHDALQSHIDQQRKELEELRQAQSPSVPRPDDVQNIVREPPVKASTSPAVNSARNQPSAVTAPTLLHAGNSVESKPLTAGAQAIPDNLPTEISPNNSSVLVDAISHRGYCVLAKVPEKQGQILNLVGVVINAEEPRRSQKGDKDWVCKVEIIDPTIVNVEDPLSIHTFKVNCFARDHCHWLPAPTRGDIIILRSIKPSTGTWPAVGYANRLRWAIYSAATRTILHEQASSDIPLEGLANGGLGVQYTPFFQPLASDVHLCSQILDWWTMFEELGKKEYEKSSVISPGQLQGLQCGRPQRLHRLISEAGPYVEPGGYFDCTVEVLKGFPNENNVFSLFVTDYSKNVEILPVQAEWCPQALSSLVLKIEMWDAAAEIGPKMREGSYYFLRNVRMVVSRGGYIEGKLVEPKIDQLEQETSEHPHLKTLLERKKTWETETGNVHVEFEDKLIKDGGTESFFNCTVEVLHAVYGPNKTSLLYVTDYTPREDLRGVGEGEAWAKGLDGRILKIALYDGQADVAQSLDLGSYCRIRKLRLRVGRKGGHHHVFGQLGGNETLVQPVNPKNALLQELLKRKVAFKGHKPISTQKFPKHQFADILSNKDLPEKYRVYGRIIDYHPRRLEEAIVQWCRRCEQEAKPMMKECLTCVDNGHDGPLEVRPNLVLTVEDEVGSRAHMTVPRESLLVHQVDWTSIFDNPCTFEHFSKCLQPVLGNLPSNTGQKTSKTLMRPEPPLLEFIIIAWLDANGGLAFALDECIPVASC